VGEALLRDLRAQEGLRAQEEGKEKVRVQVQVCSKDRNPSDTDGTHSQRCPSSGEEVRTQPP
jgi:hypothetical protein